MEIFVNQHKLCVREREGKGHSKCHCLFLFSVVVVMMVWCVGCITRTKLAFAFWAKKSFFFFNSILLMMVNGDSDVCVLEF